MSNRQKNRKCLSLKFVPVDVVSCFRHTQFTMPKRSSKGRLDLNQLAKSIVDQATGEIPPVENYAETGKNPSAVALGRLGGVKGGAARAKKLTAEERSEIARKAAKARWTTKT
jgi:hypothetical protein